MATPFSVSRQTDTSSARGVALHDGTHPSLEIMAEAERANEENVKSQRQINLVAELVSPYAVFLRSYR
jgi:hypothetical protein